MIEVKDLVKKYGDHIAVDNLNLTIEKGKIYGLLGPNGAGKSTTMNIITGYTGPTSGTVSIDGYDVLTAPEEAKKHVGYLPELPPLYLDMTVNEYLHFAAELKKVPKEKMETHMDEIIQATKIENVRSRLIKNLSKGYRQRVGLAQAIIGWPEVIILDEPTVGLDPNQIIEIRDLIRNLAEDHTIILSSHILAEVQEVCDYILIISHGKLVASDTTENLGKLMKGPKKLELLIKAPKNQIESLLKEESDIQTITIKEQKNGEAEVTIEMLENQDLREKLFFRFSENGLAILQMKESSTTLEDVFLELIQSEEDDLSEQDKLNNLTQEKISWSKKLKSKLTRKKSSTKNEKEDKQDDRHL